MINTVTTGPVKYCIHPSTSADPAGSIRMTGKAGKAGMAGITRSTNTMGEAEAGQTGREKQELVQN